MFDKGMVAYMGRVSTVPGYPLEPLMGLHAMGPPRYLLDF